MTNVMSDRTGSAPRLPKTTGLGRPRRLIGTVVLVLAAGAILAAVAHAARPDDRAGMLGVGGVSSWVVVPDAFERAAAGSLRGSLAVGAVAASRPQALPDVFERTVSRSLDDAPIRPDDRAGARGPGAISQAALPVQPAVGSADAFQWGDATVGAAAAALAVLLLAGAVGLTLRHRGRVLIS